MTTFLWGSWAGRLIITVPIDLPKLLQFYEFDVSVGEAQVNGPRQLLAYGHPARSSRSTNAAVPGNRAASNRAGVGRDAQFAVVQVTGWRVGRVGPDIHPHRLGKEWRQRGLLDARFRGEAPEFIGCGIEKRITGVAPAVNPQNS